LPRFIRTIVMLITHCFIHCTSRKRRRIYLVSTWAFRTSQLLLSCVFETLSSAPLDDNTMPTDTATAYEVHVGAWTDWSRGKVLGATLTLTREDSGLLIAFLAFFIGLVGTRFWRIGCLILHFIYSKDCPTDGVHQQRQAFLRNSPNPESAIWTLADIAISWRRNAKRVWARLLSLIALALACFVGFIFAGGYSSRAVIFGSPEVLLSGANCAFVIGDWTNMSIYGSTVGPMFTQAITAAENYARSCYNLAPGSASCSTSFVKRDLPPAFVDTNAGCPFADSKICKSSSGNLFIDTGFLDSHFDFGRNTPPNRRMQYRRRLHCAPLATEGYRFDLGHTMSQEVSPTQHTITAVCRMSTAVLPSTTQHASPTTSTWTSKS